MSQAHPQDAPGKGFPATIPLSEADRLLKRTMHTEFHPLRLLHLEDNQRDAELLRDTLAAAGLNFEIAHAPNREKFETLLARGRFDLVITDYAIPGWNGLEALASVRARDAAVPFIFFSGALGEERAVEALKRGATDYVLKSRLSRLLPVIRRALSEVEDHRRREAAEQGLREAELRYRLLFEQSPEAIVVLDPQSTLPLDFNDEACRQLGYTRAEFERRSLLDHAPAEQAEQIRAKLQEALDVGRAEFESRQFNKRREERHIWVTLRRIEMQGRPALHSIWRDITQRQEMERRHLRSQRLESIGTLAGGIAHDLNNALAPILMSASLLREGASAETLALLDLIETSAQRGAAMVRQLLTFAKGIDGQRILLQPRHLLNEMEKIIKGTFPKDIQLEVHSARDGSHVLGDATQLHQVLLNLCVNARDAMPNGGTLKLESFSAEVDLALAGSIEGARPGHFVALAVSDSGTGIAPEIVDRIFDPFFTTKGPEKGTGMGLSTVLGIVRSHQGFIRVQTQSGQGSTFTIYLPLTQAKAVEAETEQRANTFQGKGQLILVVDDDAAVRNSVEMLLQHLGFRVQACASGHEALVSFAQRRAEIETIICDLQMPHMDGVVLVQALRRMSPQTPIIVISGNAGERHLVDLKNMGVACVLSKPFAATQLAEALKTLLASRNTSSRSNG